MENGKPNSMETKHTPGPIILEFLRRTDTDKNPIPILELPNSSRIWLYPKDVAYAELFAQAPDLLAKVSEQENEIALLKEGIKAKTENEEWWSQKYSDSQKVVSEQSQRIEALTNENERLKERIDTDWYVLELRNDANRLLQERKDLVEALKEIHNLLDDGLQGSAQSKLESLLSKFEVPNQS